MADAQTLAAAPAPVPDGGADPALELPTGDPAANPDPNADPAAAPPPAADPPADPDAKPEKDLKVRFSEVTRKADRAIQAAEETGKQLRTALEIIDRLAPKPAPAAPAVETDQEPAEPVFETPEQYQRDMAEYARKLAVQTAKRQLETARADAERQRIEGEQQAYQRQVREKFAAGRAAAIEEMPDYSEVAESPDVTISVPMANCIALLEHRTKGHGTKVAYYLGKNPAEAARIAGLQPADQLLEMGMLVPTALAALAPKAPTRTNAPPPIKPLGSGSSPASKSPDDMSMDEYAAHRSKR